MSNDRRWAAGVGVGVLLACVAANLPFLLSYATRGDTAALMLHSTRFFPADFGSWMRTGFQGYFANFPEATRPYTGFIRPVVNASIWLESLLAAGPNSPVFLASNYLGHAACAALVFLAGRRLAGVSPRRALLAAVLFGGTLAALELLQSPAFRADMLAAGFALAALLAADAWRRTPRAAWLAAAWLALLLALFAKETAVSAPLLAAGWILQAQGPARRARRWTAAALLLTPLALFAVARAQAPQGTYLSLARVGANLAEVATSAFFPGAGIIEAHGVLRGRVGSPLLAGWMLLGFALNLLALLWVGRMLARREPGRAALAGMALAGAAALALPALLAPVPRMLYFGQMFTLPLLAAALPTRPHLARGAALLALALGPAALLARMAAAQPALLRGNHDSAQLQAVLARELRDPRVRRVYLVSDVVGDYGALALLQGALLRAGRGEVRPRVVSSMGQFGSSRSRGTLTLHRSGGWLRLEERCGEACDFSFPGVAAGDERGLGVPGVIAYPVVRPRRLVAVIPAAGCDLLLVGFTPAAPGVHLLRPCDGAWRPAGALR